MIRSALAALAVLVLLAGCGSFGAGGEEGTATLWVTRDRGAEVLLDTRVDAGQTLMRALASKADVDTRYGGRFVQSIDGLAGSLEDQRDWFWFVNGYEGDRSASSYRLHDGDVAWLDYRGWEREGEARVVVGAFPEPFLHGYDGKTRPAAVRFDGSADAGGRACPDNRRRLGRAARHARPRRCERARGSRWSRPRDRRAAGPERRRSVQARAQRRSRIDSQVRGAMSPGPAAALLAAAGTAALLADRIWSVALLTAVLLAVCLRAPAGRRRVYLFGVLSSSLGVFILSPFLWSAPDGTVLWEGPTLPVLGPLDITTTELTEALLNSLRLAALGLAFAAYALLLDHDRLVASAGRARRSALAVALATRLVPSLERDAAGLAESVRGRGVRLEGARGYATLLSPLVAGSLERATGLAEAMEARGFGRPGNTRAPRPPWSTRDRLALVASVLIVVVALWL